MLSKLKRKLISYTANLKKSILHISATVDAQPIKQILLIALIVTVLVESFNRRSVFGWLITFTDNPLMFIYNFLIILMTLSVGLFFKRKYFLFLLTSMIWIGLSVANFTMLGYRTTPLTFIDFQLFQSVATILKVYLSTFKIILFAGMIGIAIIFVLYTYRLFPKVAVKLKHAILTSLFTGILMVIVFNVSMKMDVVSNNFGNIAEAFQSYGFAYCFATSIVDRGINKPEDYSPEIVDGVLQTMDQDTSPSLSQAIDDPITIDTSELSDTTMMEMINTRANDFLTNSPYAKQYPTQSGPANIIMIQLESFIDVNHLVDYTFSENPTPNFTQLKEDFSSGFLTVPTIGAGTANTEFEILSGMSLDYFGAGEYPYKTILTESTVESICYDLDELGYHNHAIHNNVSTFYSRNEVYPMLGFDSFSSLEYMNNVTYNPLGWVNDAVLTDEILGALNYSEEQDFIFTVSVQPHGKYPDVPVDDTQFITVESHNDIDMDEILRVQYEYYINQLYQTDAFINDLLLELIDYDEPVVVVLYGDHLPSLNIEDELLDNNDKFQTEYVLWGNFPMVDIDKDLSAYQLSAYVMERLGYANGILTKFHQTSSQLPSYQDELLLLQYDMLYGDLNVYAGVNPHPIKPMTMGYQPIIIENAEIKGDVLVVTGDSFTDWSKVIIDGVIMDTLYLDTNTLLVPFETLESATVLRVGQIGNKDLILSQSDNWIINKEAE